MDTKSLTLLVEILDAGNLSEAARRLKMRLTLFEAARLLGRDPFR